jgi:hypothetical protein
MKRMEGLKSNESPYDHKHGQWDRRAATTVSIAERMQRSAPE